MIQAAPILFSTCLITVETCSETVADSLGFTSLSGPFMYCLVLSADRWFVEFVFHTVTLTCQVAQVRIKWPMQMLNISSETRPVNCYQNGKLTLLHHSYLLTLYFCALNNWYYWLIELFRCTLSTLEWEMASAISRFCLIWGFAYFQNVAYWNKKWSNSKWNQNWSLVIVSSYMLLSK